MIMYINSLAGCAPAWAMPAQPIWKNCSTKTHLVRITGAGLIESHPHDITITREAPNYQRGE